MKIKVYPKDEKILRTPSKKVSLFDDSLRTFCNKLMDFMARSQNAIGISAIQIGIPKQIIIVWTGDEKIKPLLMINPEILDHDGTQKNVDGCLSIPEIFIEKERFNEIIVRYQDVTGKMHKLQCKGLISCVIQHEVQHTQGILMIDNEKA